MRAPVSARDFLISRVFAPKARSDWTETGSIRRSTRPRPIPGRTDRKVGSAPVALVNHHNELHQHFGVVIPSISLAMVTAYRNLGQCDCRNSMQLIWVVSLSHRLRFLPPVYTCHQRRPKELVLQ